MVTKAPKWLIDRMERLKKQPPPTPEEVDRQMEASIKVVKQLEKDEAKRFKKSS